MYKIEMSEKLLQTLLYNAYITGVLRTVNNFESINNAEKEADTYVSNKLIQLASLRTV